MYSTSQAFKDTVVDSHTMVTRVEIYHADLLQDTPTLQLLDGNITVQDEDVRRNATITITDPTGTLTPDNASSLLSPLGNEMRLYRGVRIPSTGVDELVPLGVFGISDVKIDDGGGKFQAVIDGYDRARKVSRARFPTEYVVAKGTNYVNAIKALLVSRMPTITFNFPTTTLVTPQLVWQAGDDPWAAARSMATSLGMDLYFDVNGVCTMTVVPSVTFATEPDASYIEGTDVTILTATNKRLTDEKTYNHVIVTGENNGIDSPVRGEAYDNNPASPTYILGPYGDVVSFEASSFVTTVGQANAAAQGKLKKVLGLLETVQLQAVVNPAHDVGDIVQITRELSKIDALYILDKVTIPMTQDRGLVATCREQAIT